MTPAGAGGAFWLAFADGVSAPMIAWLTSRYFFAARLTSASVTLPISFLLASDRRLSVKRDRIGPVAGELRNRIAAQLLLGDQPAFRRFEHFSGHPVLRVAGEDRLEPAHHRVGIVARCERRNRKAQLRLRKIIERLPIAFERLTIVGERV